MKANDKRITKFCENIIRENAKMGERFNFSVGDIYNSLKKYGKQEDFATWLGAHQNQVFWYRHEPNNLEPFTSAGDLFRRVDIHKTMIAFPLLIEALLSIDVPPLIQVYTHAFYSHVVNVHAETAVEISIFVRDCEVSIDENLPSPFNVF